MSEFDVTVFLCVANMSMEWQARESVLPLGLLITRSLAGTNNLLWHTAERRHLRTNQRGKTCHARQEACEQPVSTRTINLRKASQTTVLGIIIMDWTLIIMVLISWRTANWFAEVSFKTGSEMKPWHWTVVYICRATLVCAVCLQ